MPRQQNQRAQGGGRKTNSEPKIQLFKDFSGINFEHSMQMDSVIVDTERPYGKSQSDLQMNFVLLQNNALVTSNKTIETRDNIVVLCRARNSSKRFTGPVRLIGDKLYLAQADGSVGMQSVNSLGSTVATDVSLEPHTQSGHTWTSLDYYDNKLIALTRENEIWTGDVNASYVVGNLANAAQVPNPGNTTFGINGSGAFAITGKGSLRIAASSSDTYPFRTSIAFSYVNKFGPTVVSGRTTFYSNHPVSEWHAGCYLSIKGTIPQNYGVTAVELYYTADNAQTLLFMDRVNIVSGTTWSYNWFGYIDATKMWTTANLIAPTENYTKGVHASRVTNIDGRMYFWGDSSNPQRLYIGGNPGGNLLSISPGTGGGYVDIEPGTRQEIRYVCKYKTQSGASIVTMLCDSPNSRKEQRFNLVENSISLSNEQSMKSWQAEQVAGAVGCKSYNGAVVCEDGLYSVSRYGLALTTMTMEYNSQIRANYVSDAIKLAFTDAADIDTRLKNAMLLELDGIMYMAFGTDSDQSRALDNVIFCYDIDLKAWWTYTIDVDSPILNLFHVDWQGQREGIGIVTSDNVYLLPTTQPDDLDHEQHPTHGFLIQTAKLSTQMPQQGWQYLSQIEFHFDYFLGEMEIEINMIDMFGRDIVVTKKITENDYTQYDYVVRMRIDQKVMSYTMKISGTARFRLTHFLAKVYTMSNKIGQIWGFDDNIGRRSPGTVQPTFKCYNDLREAIFT